MNIIHKNWFNYISFQYASAWHACYVMFNRCKSGQNVNSVSQWFLFTSSFWICFPFVISFYIFVCLFVIYFATDTSNFLCTLSCMFFYHWILQFRKYCSNITKVLQQQSQSSISNKNPDTYRYPNAVYQSRTYAISKPKISLYALMRKNDSITKSWFPSDYTIRTPPPSLTDYPFLY